MITGQTPPNLAPVSQLQLLPHMPAPVNLRESGGAFRHFVQQVGPTPIPKRWEFYRDALAEDFAPAYRESNRRYFDRLQRNPVKAAGVGALSILLALPMIAFHGKNGLLGQNTIRYLFALTLLAYPIYHANKLFPKLEKAYEHVRRGNPTLGRQKFREALTQTIDKVYHSFIKPLTFAGVMAYIVRLPKLMPHSGYQPEGIVENLIRDVARLIRKKDNGPVLRQLHRLSNNIEQHGTRFERALLGRVGL